MKKASKKEYAIERISRALDLPGEAAGLPRVEIVGKSRLCIENHKGILEYNDSIIDVSTQRGIIRIQGANLKICSMNSDTLMADGEILSVELGV